MIDLDELEFNPAVAAELIRRLREDERDAEKEEEHGQG